MTFRSFLNTDLPHLVETWRRQPRHPRLAEQVNQATFEARIVAMPHFDADGLILAFAGGEPVGFVHATFGPKEGGDDVDRQQGVLALLALSHSHAADQTIAEELVNRGLAYLRRGGAEICHWGSRLGEASFYLGMYGGAQVPGILEDDRVARLAAQAAGFSDGIPVSIMQRNLQNFRPVIERRQTSLRRQFELQMEPDAVLRRWWDRCQLLHNQTWRCSLVEQRTGALAAEAVFWDMQPLVSGWGVATMGLYSFYVAEERRQSGLGTYLVSEALRELAKQGVALVEVHLMQDDARGQRMASKLGFNQVATAWRLSRPL